MGMMKEHTCCFTGHRGLPQDRVERIVTNLNTEVDHLIAQGVTDFISGGALGFDQMSASLIIVKKEMGHKVRLIFALPYKDQDAFWTGAQRQLYRNLLAEADEIVYVSNEYTDDCIKKQKRYMVDRSVYCICALPHSSGGTDQTVGYAKQSGLSIISVAD
ncbi:SLOG family protein [Bacillota bacterium Meth-B3]